MVIKLLNDIVSYIDLLKKQKLNITVHPYGNALSNYMYLLSNYNIHDNPFCLAIKANSEAWNHCVFCQTRLHEHLQKGVCHGMCYAGVDEYVFPIKNISEMVGFGDSNYFSNAFKKHFNMSPKQYRAKAVGGDINI